jgi:DNA-binding PadR family transcriptional regulator
MDVKSMLLGFLMYGSMTGYELKKFFSMSFSFFSGLSYGSIYPALKKMEEEALIMMRVEVQEGAPNKKVYTITDTGIEAFVRALKEPFEFERSKSPFLTHLFFFAYLSPQERITTTATYLESVKQVQKELEAAKPEIETHADKFQYLCFQFGLRFFEDLAGNISQILDALIEEQETGREKAD